MRKILFSVLLVMAMACGGDGGNEPSIPDAEGQWNGPINTSSGSGTLTFPGDALSLTVTGNHAHPLTRQ